MQLDNVCYPVEFQSAYIKEHSKYENDLKNILERTGFVEKFRGLYKQRLKYLDDKHRRCVQKKDWFEVLKHVEGELYAIKIKAQKNIRILFSFTEYAGTEHAILLYPFEEKERGKRKSKGSYGTAIGIALGRLKEVSCDD